MIGEVQHQRKFHSEFLKEGNPNLLVVPPGESVMYARSDLTPL